MHGGQSVRSSEPPRGVDLERAAREVLARGCLRSLPNEVALTNGATLAANWRPGPGLVLLAVATLLKIVDIVCHIAVPTPAAKRDRAARDAKSLPDYLHMGERSTSAAEMKGGAV